jgi:hypothetical protein
LDCRQKISLITRLEVEKSGTDNAARGCFSVVKRWRLQMRHMIALSSLLAALALAAPQAGAQGTASPGQQGKFCLKEEKGAINCSYASMAQCEQAKTGNADQCTENRSSPTTGAGTSQDKK